MNNQTVQSQLQLYFQTLISDLSKHTGLIYYSDSVYKIYIKEVLSWNTEEHDAFHLSRMIYKDPFGENPFVNKHIIGDLFEVDRSMLEDATANLKRRTHNYYLAQSFERFESYLKNSIATVAVSYLSQNDPRLKHILSFESVDREFSFDNFRKCLNKLKCSGLLKLAEKLLVGEDYSKNKYFEYLKSFIDVVESMRHAITHTSDEWRIPESISSTPRRMFVLRQLGIEIGDGNIIIDTSINFISKRAIENLAECAHIINHFARLKSTEEL